MSGASLKELANFGQSIWLDYISRDLMASGKLGRLIDNGLRGMTSNPTIFHQSISGSADYDPEIRALAESGRSTADIYDILTIKDIQKAADLFRPVYDRTGRLDGYVSLEIDPHLAHDRDASIEEGKRLFRTVNRPNLMVKVPATPAGFEIVSALLGSGINVNVTLIFSVEQYHNTALAYIEGIKRCLAGGHDPAQVRSVASVFVSRVDTAVDKALQAAGEDDARASLRGRAAVANAALIYRQFESIFANPAFENFKKNGAQVQRVLWASTGTKDPAYSDIKYVEELVIAPTVNTLPEKTLNAVIDHGAVREAPVRDYAGAEGLLRDLEKQGIRVDDVCRRLLDDGLAAFVTSFDALLQAIGEKVQKLSVSR